jgi:F0F1-type ATP synthase membrane subunit b/b'
MKMKSTSMTIALSLAAALFQGCSGSEDEPEATNTQPTEQAISESRYNAQTSSQDAQSSLQQAATQAKAQTKEAAEAVKEEVKTAYNAVGKKVEDTVQKQIESVKADPEGQFQKAVEQVQTYLADTKYNEAASLLGELSKLELTSDQKKILDNLKDQLANAMASQKAGEATKSLGLPSLPQ